MPLSANRHSEIYEMHHRVTWFLSIIVGGCVGVLVLWIMSSMVEVKPTNLPDEPDSSVVQLIGTRYQCNEKLTQLNQAITNSSACQIDDDCVLVMDSSLTFGQCFISVQSEKAGLVSAKLKETKMHCHDPGFSACGHSTANATCRNNICAVENFQGVPRISLQKLKRQTMKSISENLQ